MKIHNLGNDYAYQQKLQEAESKQPTQLSIQPTSKLVKDVADQLQTGGETTMEATHEIFPEAKDPSVETKKGRKKKKERTDNGQQMSEEC